MRKLDPTHTRWHVRAACHWFALSGVGCLVIDGAHPRFSGFRSRHGSLELLELAEAPGLLVMEKKLLEEEIGQNSATTSDAWV